MSNRFNKIFSNSSPKTKLVAYFVACYPTYEKSFIGPDDIPSSGNKNVDWMKSSTTLLLYVLLLGFTSMVLYILGVDDQGVNMSVVSTIHAFLSFYFLSRLINYQRF